MSKPEVTVFKDSVKWSDDSSVHTRTVHVSSDEGFATFQVVPWIGSLDIRYNGREINIDAFAIPALIDALKAAVRETKR
jgi:hypothetical protein